MTKQTTITERVYGAVPGYAEESRLQEKVRQYRQPKNYERTLPAVKAQIDGRIRELFAAGQEIPDDIGDALVMAEQKDRSAELRAQALFAVVSETSDRLDTTVRAGETQAFNQLNKELGTVAGEIDIAAADLRGVNTAQEAIKAGGKAVAAWSRITELASAYEEIRAVQQKLYKIISAAPVTTDSYLAAGIFANAIDCLPYWIIRRERSGATWNDHAGADEYRAWLKGTVAYDAQQDLRGGIWPDAGSGEHLLWANRNAVFWAPTITQLEQALKSAGLATSEANSIMQQEAARDMYYAITGATPHTKYTNTYEQSAARREQLEASRRARLKQDSRLEAAWNRSGVYSMGY